MTSTLTTISANKRPRPTNQVFAGSNNNVFIHSIEKCKSKSFHFGLALFLRTAILSLDPSRLLVRQLFDTLLDCHWLYYTFGLHEDFRSLSEALRDSRTTWRNLCSCFGQSQPFLQVYSLKVAFRSGRYAHIMV